MNVPRLAAIVVCLQFLAVGLGFAQIPPDRITNPSGLQFFMDTVYNGSDDEYFLAFDGDGVPLANRLDPGTPTEIASLILPQNLTVGPGGGGVMSIAYNEDRNEYLYVYRGSQIFGQYLANDGSLIGGPFLIGRGGPPDVSYSTGSQRYVITYHDLAVSPAQVRAAVVHGDSTMSPPVISNFLVHSGALSPRIAYGAVSNKFLIVYTANNDVAGRFVIGDGSGMSGVFTIAGGGNSQQIPEVAAGPSPVAGEDRFLVQFEDWSHSASADVGLHFVDSNGVVFGPRIWPFATPGGEGWDVPGPAAYNESTGTFMATAFFGVTGFAREIDPVTRTMAINTIVISQNNSWPLAATARPDPVDPQFLILTRSNNGGDGVHAHVIHMPPPPPFFTSAQMPAGFKQVSYTERIPAAAGRPPFTYTLVSGAGNVAPGLSGPNAQGEFEGIPTTLGNFGPFRVRVTDADNNSAEEDLFHTITLKAPTPLSPNTGTNDTTPEFQWDASPGASSYRLVVENLTDGGTPVDVPGITGTSHTPTSEFTPGKTYRWKVNASDGGNVSLFSSAITFEIDTTAPAAVTLTGRIPLGGTIQLSGLVAINASTEEGVNTRDKAVDGDTNTVWSTVGQQPMQNEHITLDLGAIVNVRKVRMRSRVDDGTFFPRDFSIRLSEDNVTFTTVRTETDFVAGAAAWYTFDVPSTDGRYLRIETTESNPHPTGFFFVQIAEIEAHVDGFAKLGGAIAISASGEEGTNTKSKAVDDNVATVWSTPGRSPQQDEFIVLDLGSEREFSRVRMRSRSDDGTFFPRDFQLQVAKNDMIYSTVVSKTDFAVGNGQWVTFDFSKAVARYVRVWVTRARQHSSGYHFVQIAEIEMLQGTPSRGSIEVVWPAPGDDGNSGTANAYKIKYQMGPSINFGSAMDATGEPFPAVAGTLQSFRIDGLLDETEYTIALETSDNAGNTSPLSNALTFSTLGTPPSPVDDLFAIALSGTEIQLTWTSVGDDGETGTATTYDLIYATESITPATVPLTTQAPGEPAPNPANQAESMTLSGLDPDEEYFFALLVKDEVGNSSALSNIASAQTPDTAPPASITDLTAELPAAFEYTQRAATAVSATGEEGVNTKEKAVDGNAATTWSTPARSPMVEESITLDFGAGNAFDVGRARMCARSDDGDFFPRDFQVELAPDSGVFTSALSVNDFAIGAGQCMNFDFTPSLARYVRFRVTRSRMHVSGFFFVQIAEIELFEAAAVIGGASLSWTAPGDSRMEGVAMSYDIRYSTQRIDTLAKFDAATPVLEEEPVPQTAGLLESMVVTGIPAEPLLYFSMRTSDDVPNVSGLSNWAPFSTACPGAVDLDLGGIIVVGNDTRQACIGIAGSGVVMNGGNLTLRAGHSVTLQNGFSVESGGSLSVFLADPIP